MADSFSSEDAKSFSFEQLREEELALNRKASLVDTRTDIDNRQTGGLIWRILLLLRFFWQRFAVVLSMEWILAAVAAAVAPWAGKVLIDHVVLGQPIPDDGRGYPRDIISKIGEPYLKSSYSKDKSKEGLGLGLFIGKTLLEKNFASVNFRNSKTRNGAEVNIKWKNSELFNI